jgi:sugar lactone lactonase YvrE
MTKLTFLRSLLTAIALAAAASLANNVQAAEGDIYETNEGDVLRFRAGVPSAATFATGLANPKGIVFDGNGRMYVADAERDAVIVFTLPNGTGSTYISGLNSPVGLAFDVTGNLYVGEAATGNVLKFAPDKTKTTFATALGAPAGLAFDTSGNLFVADFSGGKIYKITPAGVNSTFATGLNFPAGLAFDNAGNLFVADSESGTILKFTPDGTKSTFATGLGRPFGIAFEKNGTLVVADNEEGATLRIKPDGTKSTIFQSEFNTPQFVAIEPAQHHLLNISTRGLVQSGDDVLIAGFFVGGTGPVGTTVVVRALGPSLTALGVANALPDPVLELRDSAGTLIASNNNWKDSQETLISGSYANLVPKNNAESVIVATLHGGSYTAIVRSATAATGTAVVEVYHVP